MKNGLIAMAFLMAGVSQVASATLKEVDAYRCDDKRHSSVTLELKGTKNVITVKGVKAELDKTGAGAISMKTNIVVSRTSDSVTIRFTDNFGDLIDTWTCVNE